MINYIVITILFLSCVIESFVIFIDGIPSGIRVAKNSASCC